jgi:hypothetical protein
MPWLAVLGLFFIADELLADIISRGRRERHITERAMWDAGGAC